MSVIKLQQVLASVKVRLDEDSLLQHSPTSPSVVGHELAEQVHNYAQQNKLGYYPALEFFQQQGGVESDLLDAMESLSWLLCRLVREEVQRKLRHVFSRVQFQSIQSMVYTMPRVRYGAANAMHDLAQHFTPLEVKLDILLSILNRKVSEEGMESFVENALTRWLGESFESVEVSSIVPVHAES